MSRQTLIARKIRRIFPNKDPSEMIEYLERYGANRKEKERVHLAILKLCEEQRLPDPNKYVEAAQVDYRDVIAWAEYPYQMKYGPTKDPKIAADLANKDKAQYVAWLNKG